MDSFSDFGEKLCRRAKRIKMSWLRKTRETHPHSSKKRAKAKEEKGLHEYMLLTTHHHILSLLPSLHYLTVYNNCRDYGTR
jgi:hypothetical protein